MSQQLSNPHYLYLHSGIATQNQIKTYIESLLLQFEKCLHVKLNKEFLVNTVTKFDGTPLNHSYVWFRSVQSADLFLNKDLDGKERFTEYPDPNHDTSEEEIRYEEFMALPTPIGARWEDLVEMEETLKLKTIQNTIKIPKERFIPFCGIEPNAEQKLKHPDLKLIDIDFFHCKINGRRNLSTSKLFAIHVAKDVTEAQIRKHFEPFVTKKDAHDKKDYPLVHIDRKSNPHSVIVSYSPGSMDGIFALCMVKKIAVNEKCTLNFDLYREN